MISVTRLTDSGPAIGNAEALRQHCNHDGPMWRGIDFKASWLLDALGTDKRGSRHELSRT